MTPEEKWIRQDRVGFSISGDVITIPRTSLRRLIEDREHLSIELDECRNVIFEIVDRLQPILPIALAHARSKEDKQG